MVTNKWVRDGGERYYLNDDGEMERNKWVKYRGDWYYVDDKGRMETGWKNINGKLYYFNSSGEMQTGWIKDNGKSYYLDKSNGKMKTGWINENGRVYYLYSNGEMATGWINIGGSKYYLDDTGAMQTGWKQIGGKWCYLSSSGEMKTGWQTISGKEYYFNSDGHMLTNTWAQDSKKNWCFFGSDGAKQINNGTSNDYSSSDVSSDKLVEFLNYWLADGDTKLGSSDMASILGGMFDTGKEYFEWYDGTSKVIERSGNVIKLKHTINGTTTIIKKFRIRDADLYPEIMKYMDSSVAKSQALKSAFGKACSAIGVTLDVMEAIYDEINNAKEEKRAVNCYMIAATIVSTLVVSTIGAVFGFFVGAYAGSLCLTPGVGTLIGAVAGTLFGYAWSKITKNVKADATKWLAEVLEELGGNALSFNE